MALKSDIVIATLLPGVMALVSVLIPPLAWFGEFMWDWIVHDDVIAISDFEMNVRSSMSPASLAFIGAIWGLALAAIYGTYSWFNG